MVTTIPRNQKLILQRTMNGLLQKIVITTAQSMVYASTPNAIARRTSHITIVQ
jgi:hypothetical protein